MKDLISLSCSLNLFSASSNASSLIWGKTQNIRSSIFQTSALSSATFSPNTSTDGGKYTCGEIPVSCFRWLLTRFDFLIIECMLSLEILSMNVSSSPFLYFTTVDSRGKTWAVKPALTAYLRTREAQLKHRQNKLTPVTTFWACWKYARAKCGF